MVLRYGINPKLSSKVNPDARQLFKCKILTVKDPATMEHWQSETKYPLEVLLDVIQCSTLFVWHLFVDLEGHEPMQKEHMELTSFSPNENTGTRSALMRSDKRMLGTHNFYVPVHHRHLDEPHSTGKSE
jgi:hypothetical protein